MKIELYTLTAEAEPYWDAKSGLSSWTIVVKFGWAEVARLPWDSHYAPEQAEINEKVAKYLRPLFTKEVT